MKEYVFLKVNFQTEPCPVCSLSNEKEGLSPTLPSCSLKKLAETGSPTLLPASTFSLPPVPMNAFQLESDFRKLKGFPDQLYTYLKVK